MQISYLCGMKNGFYPHLDSAEYLKCQLIDFFIQKASDDIIIGNEVMYGTKRKVVDLLVISKGKLIAIEIKGENDDLRRVQEQIEECSKVFDYIVIFTTNAHLERLKESIINDIGIYAVDSKGIKRIRQPRKINKQNKQEMLYSINTKYLKNKLGLKSNFNSDEIRIHASKKNMKELHLILYEYFVAKIEAKFKLFLSEKGKETHVDDIPLLSSYYNIE